MTGGAEILHKMKVKAGLAPAGSETGKGKIKMAGRKVRHGYFLLKGKSNHPMEDYLVAEYRQVGENNLGLFAIFDGHLGHDVPDFLRAHLFDNILNEGILYYLIRPLRPPIFPTRKEGKTNKNSWVKQVLAEIVEVFPDFWTDMENSIRKAYKLTDEKILEKAVELGRGGSTSVTAILIDGVQLVVANIGDSRAVICKNGEAKQLSVDHEPNSERESIEEKGGFVSNFPGDVPRVDGQLAVARAFGDRSLKKHLSSDPDITDEIIDENVDFLILASDGLWKVMSNQEAVDAIKDIKDPRAAAKHLAEEAVVKKSKDDISCIVVKFE